MSPQLISYIHEFLKRDRFEISIPMFLKRYEEDGYSTTFELIHDNLSGVMAHLRESEEMKIHPFNKWFFENQKSVYRRLMYYIERGWTNVPPRHQAENAAIAFALQSLPVGSKSSYGVRIPRKDGDLLWKVYHFHRANVESGSLRSWLKTDIIGLKHGGLKPSESAELIKQVTGVIPETLDNLPVLPKPVKGLSANIKETLASFPRHGGHSRSRARRKKMKKNFFGK